MFYMFTNQAAVLSVSWDCALTPGSEGSWCMGQCKGELLVVLAEAFLHLLLLSSCSLSSSHHPSSLCCSP